MQIKFYSFLFFLFILSASSCKKWLPENRIIGTWKITSAEKIRLFNRTSFATGYENGTFIFNENGTSTFTDANGKMNGYWTMRRIDRGYYDENGNWQTNARNDLLIKLYDFNSNRIIEWYFDNMYFRHSGNNLVGFMYSSFYNYKYTFSKK